MALANYTDIVGKIGEWLNREGANDLATNTADFIDLAQRRIQREVRVPPMEALTTLTLVGGRAPIPSEMLDVKEMVAFDGSSAWDISRSTYSQVRNKRLKTGAKGPSLFDTVAGNFEFGPEPSAGVSVDLVYYQELDFITVNTGTNWFVTYAPELILYASLIEASVFIKDFEQEKTYQQKYNEALKRLMIQKQKAEWSGRLHINRV